MVHLGFSYVPNNKNKNEITLKSNFKNKGEWDLLNIRPSIIPWVVGVLLLAKTISLENQMLLIWLKLRVQRHALVH